MAKQQQPFNPFYAALIVFGIVFTITACAYAVMIVRAPKVTSAAQEAGLMKLLDERGMEIMGIEVLLLAVATVGAIGLDQWRSRGAFRAAERPAAPYHAERGNEEYEERK